MKDRVYVCSGGKVSKTNKLLYIVGNRLRMESQGRRTFLKELGTATTLTAVAGCLDGGNSDESSPNDTSTPANTPDDTPEEEHAAQNGEADSIESLQYIPASSELQGLEHERETDVVAVLEHGYPATIAEKAPEDVVLTWEEENAIAPSWAEFSISDIEDKTSFSGVQGGASVYSLSEDAQVQLGDVEEIGEMQEMTLYEYNTEDEFATLLADEDTVIAKNQEPDEELRDLFSIIVEAGNGERTRYLQAEPLGMVWGDIQYEDAISTQLDGPYLDLENDQLASASRISFEEDKITAERGRIYEDGSFETGETDTAEYGEPIALWSIGWGAR